MISAGLILLGVLLWVAEGTTGLSALSVGSLASAVSGYLAIDILLRCLRRNAT